MAFRTAQVGRHQLAQRVRRGGAHQRMLWALIGLMLVLAAPLPAHAQSLHEMPVERWATLREAERYQMKIAEEYFRQSNWKAAASEYEKFISLHEDSSAAPYAHLKWSLCQVNLRKLNTAIKDGFQSVIDYWPDSPDAVAAAYFIGRTYKEMGEPKPAKKAYAAVLATYRQHLVATLARVDLVDLARIENDTPRRVALWRELVFDTARDDAVRPYCETASRELAAHCFLNAAFAEGVSSLATTCTEEQLAPQVVYYAQGPISQLTGQAETKAAGEKVADQAVSWLLERVPGDLSDPQQKTLARQLWYYIADVNSAARRVDKVPEVYQQILGKYGADDDTLGRFGAWLRSQGRHNEARETYARFENKAGGLANVATSFREEQKWGDAIQVYQRLVADDPDHAADWQGLAAYTFRQAQKPDEAVAIYTQLLVSDAQRANAWQFEIGNTYRDFGRYQEAIAAYRQCENFPDCYWQMAGCHRGLAEWGEAISLYQQILAGFEAWAPQSLLQIGYTYEQAGEKERAIKAFQQVCKKFPKTGQASEAHVRLNEQYGIRVTLGGDKQE